MSDILKNGQGQLSDTRRSEQKYSSLERFTFLKVGEIPILITKPQNCSFSLLYSALLTLVNRIETCKECANAPPQTLLEDLVCLRKKQLLPSFLTL